jgi:hypothetical protein
MIDSRIAGYLLGHDSLDWRLARFARLVTPNGTSSSAPVSNGLVDMARAARGGGSPLVIYFRGADETMKRNTALALAGALASPLLVADLRRASRWSGHFEEWLQDLARETMLRDVVVYLEGLDATGDDAARESVLRALPGGGSITILSGTSEWSRGEAPVDGVITVPFDTPGWQERRQAWQIALRERGINVRGQALDTLAGSFLFTGSQIDEAALTAERLARYCGRPANIEHVFESARARSGSDMGNLARKVSPTHSWDEIVLPAESIEQLREICRRVRLRYRVLEKWGFGRRLSTGKGVNALFHGHSGTGKTMAADVIARELQLDLYKIDLAGVVSKYIGETEKNLDRVFTAAENANVILLFDEADALFGKRSEVRDSRDRYANLEVSYLLQKMEQYEGVSILATNLRQNLDDAFLRRLAFTVQFPFPDEESRRRIWQGMWPEKLPLSPDVDHGWLASRFVLSGGNIRNVAVAAAYLAAQEESAVTMKHVIHAIRSEFLKMGKTLSMAELTPPEALAAGAA